MQFRSSAPRRPASCVRPTFRRSRRLGRRDTPATQLLRLLEPEQKLIGVIADRWVEHGLGVVIALVREDRALCIQLETRGEHIVLHSCWIDSMKRFGGTDA